MVEMQTKHVPAVASTKLPMDRRVALAIPSVSTDFPAQNATMRLRDRLVTEVNSPVNQNGSFEFDRVLKSGYVQKRTQKTKTWRTIYLVLRPNTLSIYKSDKEDKLRHKIYLSDLTAVTLLKDPKHKRQNVFGLFSPSKNYHFQASSLSDAQAWVDQIRKDARIEEEEEEMFLASPVLRQQLHAARTAALNADPGRILSDHERLASSSPEPIEPLPQILAPEAGKRTSRLGSSGMSGMSGMSGNDVASQSDFSDTDFQRLGGTSFESLAARSPVSAALQPRPELGGRNTSQVSGVNGETDPDRIIWQGWLWLLRGKGGVRQWKDSWAVLRPRNLILYKDESEYSARFIFQLSSVLSVVDTDPMSRTKTHCFQIITDEKTYRLCAHDEESLVRCLGAFKSLLAKRRELEAKAAAAAVATPAVATPAVHATDTAV